MIKHIKNWFSNKITLIFAPNHGSRSLHISMSYPFFTLLIFSLIGLVTAGVYISRVYIGYYQAIETNKKLIAENRYYSGQVDQALNMLHKVQNIEARLRGMLGMKNIRNVIENYHIGGAEVAKNLNLPNEIDSLFERRRFEANMGEFKREFWEQQQRAKNIESFIDKKKDVLLSTPSIWPIFGYTTSKYGWRTHPITGKRENHRGLDMYSLQGRNTPIRATANGKIIHAGWAGSFGRMVIVGHGNGFSTRYAHCSKILVKQGEQVEQGQIVAYVGNTGLSTGPHLHYEVWYRGKRVNPKRFVKGR
jgi:murein DD-endopeptidase MepM/ murein hydrolase activator NlpD